MTEKPYTWILRVDVAPEWVADGFTMTDERAREMLANELPFADMETEMAASVIAAPSPLRIAKEQGYGPKHSEGGRLARQIMADAPNAYSFPTTPNGAMLERALSDAIALLDSVAFVRDENDNTGAVLSKLRGALSLIRGTEPLPQPADAAG